ncbi:MAG: DegV family protein [Anaerolineae bacterium]
MIKIVTDSTCYLPPALLTEHGIPIVPLSIAFGSESYREGIDIDTETFFYKLARAPDLPQTSQPGVEEFVAAWRPILDAGHEIVTVLISSGLSGTVSSARAAQQMLAPAPISVIDSLSTAMGLGMQVLRAAEWAAAGATRAQIGTAIERMRKEVRIVLVPDTLEFLHRGGRINTAQRWLGTLLQVKPLLEVRGGVVEPLEQVRTARRAAARLVESTAEHLGDDEHPWIAVMHSRSPEVARQLREMLHVHYPHARYFLSEIGPTIGVHIGPGGSGIMSCPSRVLGL